MVSRNICYMYFTTIFFDKLESSLKLKPYFLSKNQLVDISGKHCTCRQY